MPGSATLRLDTIDDRAEVIAEEVVMLRRDVLTGVGGATVASAVTGQALAQTTVQFIYALNALMPIQGTLIFILQNAK